jgi:hypothetical protein
MNIDDDLKRKKDNEEISKKILLDDISKKIKTTMIGSLDAIEKCFSTYFSDEETRMDFLEKFRDARKRILDLGNEQILKIKDDINNYNIESKSYVPKNLVKRK